MDITANNDVDYVVDDFNRGIPIVIEECKGGFEVFAFKGEGQDVLDSIFFYNLADVFEWATNQLMYDFDVKFTGYLSITKKETL